jgi:hypothetical protein
LVSASSLKRQQINDLVVESYTSGVFVKYHLLKIKYNIFNCTIITYFCAMYNILK